MTDPNDSSDSSRSDTDAPTNAERLMGALRSAASDLNARDALSELGDRARSIVEELARGARGSRPAGEAPAATAAGSGFVDAGFPDATAGMPFPALHRRLDELRACVGEVADVLEATVERLETVELQLGDPDVAVERQLSDGIERCERVLMGIEHRVLSTPGGRRAGAEAHDPAPPPRAAAMPTVLVVAASSRRRAGLCVAIEHQGLATLAAADMGMALRIAAHSAPPAALLVLDGTPDRRATCLEEWKAYEERGTLPRAAVLVSSHDDLDAASFGFETIKEIHGEAAMAASLVRLTRAVREPADDLG